MIDVQVEERQTGVVSLLALVLIAILAWTIWNARGSLIEVVLWAAIPLVLVAIFFRGSREYIGKIFGGAGRMAVGAVKSVASGAGSAVNASARRRSYDVEIRTFRVVDGAGATHQCVLRGNLVGGRDLRLGDDVVVHGVPSGHGVLKVRRIEVLSAGTTVSGRVPIAAQIIRARHVLLLVLGLLFVGYLMVRLR